MRIPRISVERLIWGPKGSDLDHLNQSLKKANIIVSWAYNYATTTPERLIVGVAEDITQDILDADPSIYNSLLKAWLNLVNWAKLVAKGKEIPLVAYMTNSDLFITESVMDAMDSLIE